MIRKRFVDGFCRADFVVAVGATAFLMLWVAPALCRISSRSEQAICVNNLRLIGGGFARWASDNDQRNPWQIHYPQDPGTKGGASAASAWIHFFYISNYLSSPKFLADPADRRLPGQPFLRVATSWHNVPGGFPSLSYRNNALSYSVGVYSTPTEPNSIVSSDRNIFAPNTFNTTLFEGVRAVEPATAFWTQNVHQYSGNLLFSDGRAEETDTPRLREAVGWNNNWNRGFIFPFVE